MFIYIKSREKLICSFNSEALLAAGENTHHAVLSCRMILFGQRRHIMYIMETANSQTEQIPDRAVSQQLHSSARQTHILITTLNTPGSVVTNKRKIQRILRDTQGWQQWQTIELPAVKRGGWQWWWRRAGGGSLCDPPALWERLQWKIVPIANPWPANYSFDPLSVCRVGGRRRHNTGLRAVKAPCVLGHRYISELTTAGGVQQTNNVVHH